MALPGDDSSALRGLDAATPHSVPADAFDTDDFADGHFEWLVREIDAGRLQPPPECAIDGPAVSISFVDAWDASPELLTAMCGLDGLGGQSFGQGENADALCPGPVLAVLTAQAVSRLQPQPQPQPQPAPLTDDELTGVLQAARRLANLAAYQQTVVIAEFARRRQAQFEAAMARGVPVGCRDGEFPGEELAMELVDTGAYTSARIDTAIELATRLPRTLAGMKEGLIDLDRACTIASRTRAMSDIGAACADEILAAAAPDLRPDQLARKAAALELKLAPEAVAARKKLARQLDQRVEARREESGNASLAGRELDTADVIASKAYIDAIAVKLRNAGLEGPIGSLRALAMTDLTQGRNPLDRIKPRPPVAPETSPPGNPTAGCTAGGSQPSEQLADNSASGASDADEPVPLPALINLLVPAGTLLGWGTAPAQAAGWGLLDVDETSALVRAAAQHPRTRWCMTIIAPDGTAIAHGCATGQHLWPGNSPPSASPPGYPPDHGPGVSSEADDSQPPQQAAQLLNLLRRLNITLEPIARETCDHAHAEDHYVPSRKLKHLIHARAQTCTAPACNAQAVHSDLDHTVPYPDGPSDECNLNPKCRRHHRAKQAPGWRVAQPVPDTTTWTTPSGRTHTTTPTSYTL
jgi:hypothetical protein